MSLGLNKKEEDFTIFAVVNGKNISSNSLSIITNQIG